MDIDKLFEFEECQGGYVLKSYLLKDVPSVTEVEVPSEYRGKSVISIGFEAFMNANHLCLVKISEGIEEVGTKAFYSCENLKTVLLPDSLTAIRDNAFDCCAKLDNISFPSGLKVIGCESFSKCNIKSAVLPSGLEKLGLSAFFSCRMKSVILPKNIKTISRGAFSSCHDLENIDFPDSLKEIESHAFWGCGFKTLTFPSGLERIDYKAFAYCEKLEKVDFQKGSPFIEFFVFERCPKLSAENILQGLACSTDITKPFPNVNYFNWDSALREDIFTLAMKYDSFALFDKEKVLQKIVEWNLSELLPLTENAGWNITEECMEELLEISLDNDFVETTAWLLDYKNRKMGFGKA